MTYAPENQRGQKYGYMYLQDIVNDCHKQHFKQMEEVQRTRPKMTTNASGFGLHSKNHDLQILPLEAPEYLGIIFGAFATYLIGISL
jgi:hypothetical protein